MSIPKEKKPLKENQVIVKTIKNKVIMYYFKGNYIYLTSGVARTDNGMFTKEKLNIHSATIRIKKGDDIEELIKEKLLLVMI